MSYRHEAMDIDSAEPDHSDDPEYVSRQWAEMSDDEREFAHKWMERRHQETVEEQEETDVLGTDR